MSLNELWSIAQHGKVEDLQRLVGKLSRDECDALLTSSHRRSGDNVTHLLARHGRLAMVQYLSSHWKIPFERRNLDGKVPLHEAASSGHAEVVEFLLGRGVTVDPLKRAGWTPLMMACTRGRNLASVAVLVDAGANLNIVNKDEWNCFHIACRSADVDVIAFLHGKSPLLCNNVSTNGRTPLHTAALHGRKEVVRFLIETCKVNADASDSCGSTPFMDAVRSGDVPTMKLLLAAGSNVTEATNAVGLGCLHVAAEANRLEAISFLLDIGASDVNCAVDADSMCKGQTPLHLAYKEDNDAAVAMLLSRGARTDAKDGNGRLASEMLVRRSWQSKP